MGGAPADIVRAGAAIGLGVLVLRYLWRRVAQPRPDEPQGEKRSAASPKNGSASADAGDEDTVFIYFGSQTGTAEGFSREIEQDAPSHDLKATAVDLEEFDPKEFAQHKAVVLIVATYGEGDPTDNAMDFFKWLQDESLPADTLKGMSYTVMGCGNRQYVNFNQCAKDADKHMQRLGATRILEIGMGDDDQNIEEDWEQWKDTGLWAALQTALGAKVSQVSEEVSEALETPEAAFQKLQLRAEVREAAKDLPIDPLVQVGGADVLGKWYFGAFLAPVSACSEIRQVGDPAAGKTTKHIDLDIRQHPSLDWKTADNLEVLPRNPADTVEWFAAWLGVADQLESSLTFARAAGVDKAVKKPFPTPCTVRMALELYCDLCFMPSKANAKRLAAFADDAADRAALEALLRDRDALHWLSGEGVRLSFREFVELFMPTAKVDLGAFLQVCPRQKSRPYTIASSSLEDRHTIGICVSMVQEAHASLADVASGLASRGHPAPHAAACLARAGAEAGLPRAFCGACSTMLCRDVGVKSELWIYARASSFRLPRQASKPVVMIGAGTGIAPFRAFTREFRAECRANAAKARTKTYLYFGCTRNDVDFLYKDELQEALTSEKPALKELITAFSREQEQKVYVQHRLGERAEEVAQLVAEGAFIYVCGAVSMGRAVREQLAAALGSNDCVNRLVTEGRFVEELW